MEDPYMAYILSDVQNRLGARIEYEDLPQSARILARNAALIYKRLISIKQMIDQLSKSKRGLFSQKSLDPRVEALKRDYEKLSKEYEDLINSLIEKAKIIFMDFGELKNFLRSSRIVLQPINCPVCGAPLNLPENSKFVKCPYCGTTLNVIEVYEILTKSQNQIR
jgi:LSD1 subclass zinc finger protein